LVSTVPKANLSFSATSEQVLLVPIFYFHKKSVTRVTALPLENGKCFKIHKLFIDGRKM